MQLKSLTRIAVFIDYQNLIDNYREQHKERIELPFWKQFSDKLKQALFEENFVDSEIEAIKHIGTWIVVGKKKRADFGEKGFLDYINMVDEIHGKIVVTVNKPEVKTEITCQMLMGGFQKRFDLAILASDDICFIPTIQRLQDYLGINVVQIGFDPKSELRPKCYGNVKLEEYDKNFEKK